jgi:hypothetical protein
VRKKLKISGISIKYRKDIVVTYSRGRSSSIRWVVKQFSEAMSAYESFNVVDEE